MARKKNTLLTYLILILLAAALIASGRYINSKKSLASEKDYAIKLAELRSDLTGAAKGGSNNQRTSGNKRTTTRKSPQTGST